MPFIFRPQPGALARALACALTLLTATSPAFCQGVKPQVRLTPQTLPKFLEEVRRAYRLPALGAAIVRGDRISVSVVGARRVGDGAPVRSSDAWHLGSDTKSMTATLIGMLVEDGVLAWDSTLEKLLPENAATMNPKFREVTLQQLLFHRAGFGTDPTIPYGTTHDEWRAKTAALPDQRREFVSMILKEAPANPPGTRSEYSNRSYITLGAIAERATGKSWEDLMRQRLFEPLGMKSAGFGPMATSDNMDAISPHLMTGGQVRAVGPGTGADNPLVIGPAGTVHCSLEDWGKYARFWLRGLRGEVASGETGGGETGGKALLKPETFLVLGTAPPGGEFAAGWKPVNRAWGGDVLTHAGSNTMNYCVIWLAPAKNFATLVTTNVGDASKACDDVSGAMISELSKLSAP